MLLTPDPSLFFFFNDTATTEIYTLSLHDALPICHHCEHRDRSGNNQRQGKQSDPAFGAVLVQHEPPLEIVLYENGAERRIDRKSTRLNSSHDQISYAVFCLKKKKKTTIGKQDVIE